ncbi:unnamed protein product [Adineta steineri]|uniref:Uncharacterized protein n=1 Tax=Adineta steineri TaxID=433720 RepID=A0A818YUG8_9BILA|nr:unnamed protein product [Adineta steineri]
MSYRYVYPNGTSTVGATPGVNGYGVDPSMLSAGYPTSVSTNGYDHRRRRRSYSPGSFSSDSCSDDDYEYRGRMITREKRCPRDVVRAPTPPPIIKRVVERAPTPEAPVMERVIIRPQAQEIVERVIEQPRTPPPRIIQKEMQEEAPPPIVRTRVIKVDRPLRSGYSQPGSPYGNPCNGLPSISNGLMTSGHTYRTHSIAGSTGRPRVYRTNDNDPSFSSGSSFEYTPSAQMSSNVPQTTMMMMPASQQVQPMSMMQQQQMQQQQQQQQQQMQQQQMQQQQMQPMGVMQQQPVQSMGVMQQQPMQQMGVMQQQPMQQMGMMQQQPVQQQIMYRPVQMQSSMPQMAAQSVPPLPSSYIPQQYMYPAHQGMSYGYRPMMQQGRMIPSGMPMMAAGNAVGTPTNSFQSQPQMYHPMAQQLVY